MVLEEGGHAAAGSISRESSFIGFLLACLGRLKQSQGFLAVLLADRPRMVALPVEPRLVDPLVPVESPAQAGRPATSRGTT